jgi:primosomal replication protein N
VTFALAHGSRQIEAGAERQVDLEIACVAVEEIARAIAVAPLGTGLALRGFLAPKGRSSRQLTLHVTEIEFEERNEDHASTQRKREG